MTNDEGMTKLEFGFRASFVIRHSSFVISLTPDPDP